MKRQILYLNTDLETGSPQDLTPPAEALQQKQFFKLHAEKRENGSWSARFEIDMQIPEANHTIARMLDGIETLDESSKSIWAGCTYRDFNIGYECGHFSL